MLVLDESNRHQTNGDKIFSVGILGVLVDFFLDDNFSPLQPKFLYKTLHDMKIAGMTFICVKQKV